MGNSKSGYEAIIVNNNPETVSTDFSISDKLYFEPLTEEDVMNIINLEQPKGVVVQFGGQTINLADKLAKHGVKILGTTLENLNRLRIEKSSKHYCIQLMCHNLKVRRPLLQKKH